ncbi:hypothetical protein [Petroclostridium xylanilyticum]|uniref:hypothetical protein n=1 Tax=Petroclostridium xylanilyticum TaxID=1792311 RepID=UPI000B98633B|nr:hypothetical protein [Petroclostridium xylanilyticum]
MRLALMGDLHYPHIERGNQKLFETRERFYEGYLKKFLEIDADWYISLENLTHKLCYSENYY